MLLGVALLLSGTDAAIEEGLSRAGIDFGSDMLTAGRVVFAYPAAPRSRPHGLAVTFVCVDQLSKVVGAVGLDVHDLRSDATSQWVTGTIVRPDQRGPQAGRLLMSHLEKWAAEQGFDHLWVGTSGAAGFYEGCGWHPVEEFMTSAGQRTFVLHKLVA